MENRIKKIVKTIKEIELIKVYVEDYLDDGLKYKIPTDNQVIEIIAGIYERYPNLDWLEMEKRMVKNKNGVNEEYIDITITEFCEKSKLVKELLIKQK